MLAWGDEILPTMSKRARARLAAGRFTAVADGAAVMALPNEAHRSRCEDLRDEVEAALASRFGAPVPVRFVVEGTMPPPAEPAATAAPAVGDETSIDPAELVDASAGDGSAVERITQAFPGAAFVDPD